VNRNIWRTRFGKEFGTVVRQAACVAAADDDNDNDVDGGGINVTLIYSHGITRYMF
jgi:hypothetical protein